MAKIKSGLWVSVGCAAAFVAGLAASPASASVVLCSSGPGINLTMDQCTRSGNDHLADVNAAILAATGSSPASLALYGKSDSNFSLFTFSVNSDPTTGQITDWSVLDGAMIKYVTIKAGTGFKLYELAGAGASSGIGFSTLGLFTNSGRQPDISHISFFTVAAAAVPEPATWALLIGGFFAIGAGMRSGAPARLAQRRRAAA